MITPNTTLWQRLRVILADTSLPSKEADDTATKLLRHVQEEFKQKGVQ